MLLAFFQSFLFGTATTEDLDNMGEHLKIVTQTVIKQNRMIKQTYQGLITVNAQVNNLIEHVNKIDSAVKELLHKLPTLTLLTLISEYLGFTEACINQIQEDAEQIITDLVDAGLGKVTSQLLSISNLRKAIDISQSKFNLIPLFSKELAAYYFPILESTLTTTDILIHIPMKSKTNFQAWQLIPFPMKVRNSLVSIDMTEKLIIVSDDFTLIDATELHILENCKSTYLNYHVCPAWTFSFINSKAALCEVALLKENSTKAVTYCKYRPVEEKPVYHVHLQGQQYFYFPKDVGVSMICQNKEHDSKYKITSGFYVAPDYCEVKSDVLTTLPTHHHIAFTVNLSSEFFKLNPPPIINISNINLKTNQLDLLTLMNTTEIKPLIESSLPILLSPPVYISYQVVVGCIVIFCIILFSCCFYKLSSRYKFLKNMKHETVSQVFHLNVRKKSSKTNTQNESDSQGLDEESQM